MPAREACPAMVDASLSPPRSPAPHQRMPAGPPAPPPAQGPGQRRPAGASGWTASRVVSLVTGAVLALVSLCALAGSGGAIWAQSQRTDGYVPLGSSSYSTAGHALASETIRIHDGWDWLGTLIGQIRVRVTKTGGGGAIFAGIAPSNAAGSYLSGVQYTTVTSYNSHGQRIGHPGTVLPRPPASTPIWVARASGARTATLRWTMRNGDWTVVVMHRDGSAGVAVHATVAATLPALSTIAAELLVAGVILALIAAVCVIVPVRLAAGHPPAS
jgi:hypothetical protein